MYVEEDSRNVDTGLGVRAVVVPTPESVKFPEGRDSLSRGTRDALTCGIRFICGTPNGAT